MVFLGELLPAFHRPATETNRIGRFGPFLGKNLIVDQRETVQTHPLPSDAISLEIYKALVDRCAALRLNRDIANGSSRHAVILIRKLFEIAKGEVLLVTGRLTEVSGRDRIPIYSDQNVIAEAQKFLRRADSKLSIIVQCGVMQSGDGNRFLAGLKADKERLGTVKVYLPQPNALADTSPHFMVTDKSAYRFETGEDALPTNESITAVANFGNEATAKDFSAIFADLEDLLHTDENISRTLEFPPETAAA